MRKRHVRSVLAVCAISLFALPVEALPPNPVVSSLFVPIEGDVLEPGTGNLVHLTGEVHVLTQAAFDEAAGQWSVSFYGNLVRVRGTSSTSGITYLGVGADNTSWVGINPGPPTNEVPLTFELLGVNPGPPQGQPGPPDSNPGPPDVLSVSFMDFVFAQEAGYEGRLQSVTAAFVY